MDELYHYGTDYITTSVPGGPGSGRYAHGTGENPYQHDTGFLNVYQHLIQQKLTESEIAQYFGYSSINELRKRKTYEVGAKKAAYRTQAIELYNQGWSKTAIAEKLGISDGTVGNYLKSTEVTKAEQTLGIAEQLKKNVEEYTYIDVGEGTNAYLGVSKDQFDSAVKRLQDEGYTVKEI